MSETKKRVEKFEAKRLKRQNGILEAKRLKKDGHSNVAIGRRLNVSESTIRNWLKQP